MKAILFIACLATVAYGQNTLCQRLLTGAGVDGRDPNLQISLVSTLVVRAFAGVATVNATMKPWPAVSTCTGLISTTLNKPYFDGTKPPMKNFITDLTAQATLADHLTGFFMFALGCFEGLAVKPYTPNPAAFKAMHAPMLINKATMDEFFGVLTTCLVTFGVTPTATDLGYVTAAFGKFNRGGSMEVCSQADCPAAVDFAEYRVDTTTGFWLADTPKPAAVADAMVGVPAVVHWDLGPTNSIVEVDSPTGTTLKTGGFTSGAASAATFGYSKPFGAPGTYYWYSTGADGKANRGTIIVGQASGAAQLAIPVLAVLLSVISAIVAPKLF